MDLDVRTTAIERYLGDNLRLHAKAFARVAISSLLRVVDG